MVILYAGVKNISPEYYEAAKLDGATGFKAATKITIPLLMPTIKVLHWLVLCVYLTWYML